MKRLLVVFDDSIMQQDGWMEYIREFLSDLDVLKYVVIPIYITSDLKMYMGDLFCKYKRCQSREQLLLDCKEVFMYQLQNCWMLASLSNELLFNRIEYDVLMPIFNGIDEMIFRLFKLNWGDFDAYALCKYRIIVRRLLQDIGMNLTYWFVIEQEYGINDDIYRKAQRLGYPLVVKSDLNTIFADEQVVYDEVGLYHAANDCLMRGYDVVVEKYVRDSRQLCCIVCVDDGISFIKVAQLFKEPLFHLKYLSDVDINRKIVLEMQRVSSECVRLLHIEGLSRVDFLYDECDDELYVNEIHVLPWLKNKKN